MRIVRHRLRGAWILFVVLGIAVGWKAAGAAVAAALPNVSEATSMFVETVLLTAFYGVLAWRLLIVPMQRRQASVPTDRAADQTRASVVSKVERPQPLAVLPRVAGRHLALVPELPD